jgi:SAM-dependent methyltransferase
MPKTHDESTFYEQFRQGKATPLGSWIVHQMALRVYDCAQIKEGHRVLEIGAGKGYFAKICFEKEINYSAIEPNVHMARALESQNARVYRNLVPPLPEMDGMFDRVVMINVMEHMDTMTAALSVAEQVHGILNPGGRFVIVAPDYVNWRFRFFQGDFSHNYVTTLKRLRGLLMSAGYDTIQGKYQCAHLQGLLAILISAMAGCLPFGTLNALFPDNKILQKLYKLQTALLRRILIFGEKQA